MSKFSVLINDAQETMPRTHSYEDSFSYFDTPARSHLLNILVQLVPHAPGLILVQGETGSGKTTLLHRLKNELQNDWSLVVIEKFTDTATVIKSIFDGFSFKDRGEITNEQVFLDHLKTSKIHSVLLLDDAQHFSVDFIAKLKTWMQDLADYPISIVLFATPYASVLDSLQFLAAHRFHIPLFTYTETQEFLRLQVKQKGITVPTRVSKNAFELSKGNPGRIIELTKTQSASARSWFTGAFLIWTIGTLFLAGIVTFIAVKYSQIADYNVPEVASNLPLKQNNEDLPPHKSSTTEASNATKDAAVVDTFKSEKDQFKENVATLDAPPKEAPAKLSQPALPETVPRQVEVPSTEVKKALPTQNDSPVSKESAPISERLDSRPSTNTEVKANLASDASPGPHDENWLLLQRPELFTIQFAALKNRASIQKMINTFDDKSLLALYGLTRKSGELHALTYGLFETQSEAEQIAKKLAPRLGDMKPWIRTLQAIHVDIKKTQAIRQPYP